jgi:hypothetical protein
MAGSELDDQRALLKSSHPSSSSNPDPESQSDLDTAIAVVTPTSARKSGINEFLRHLDRGLSNRGLNRHQSDQVPSPVRVGDQSQDELGDGAPPEWALLLLGCLLGLATGICVAAFNHGVM